MSIVIQLDSSVDLFKLSPISPMPIYKLSTINILNKRPFYWCQSTRLAHWFTDFE